jgi:hypothetical protein
MVATPTTPIAVIGPTDGSMVVDAIVTQPIVLPAAAQTATPTPPRRRRPRLRPDRERRNAGG